jgi:hypothetical protein
MMNASKVLKFFKSERDSTVLSSHNDSISIVRFFTCQNSMEIGEPRHPESVQSYHDEINDHILAILFVVIIFRVAT